MKICKITKEGKEQIVYILSKGDFFGENNLLLIVILVIFQLMQ